MACPICGGDHPASAHVDPIVAVAVAARAMCEAARLDAIRARVRPPTVLRTVCAAAVCAAWSDAEMWLAHAMVLTGRGAA